MDEQRSSQPQDTDKAQVAGHGKSRHAVPEQETQPSRLTLSRRLMSALAVLVVAFGLFAPHVSRDVEAHHGGQMTLRGTVYNTNGAPLAGANVYVYNGSGGFVRGTTTNSSGVYAIVLDKGHTEQIRIRKTYGTGCNYSGSGGATYKITGVNSGWFVPSSGWANPTYQNYRVSVLYQC